MSTVSPHNEGGKLPEGWRIQKLGDITEVISGQSPPGSTYRRQPEGLPFFQGKADFGPRHPVATFWCVEPKKIAKPGDILISVRAPVGPTNVAKEDCCIGRGLAAIRCGKETDREFLLLALRKFESAIAERGTGSTFDAINRAELLDIEIPLPPLAEQKRIAAVLTERLATVEQARKAVKEQAAAIDSLPAALLRQAFSGAI